MSTLHGPLDIAQEQQPKLDANIAAHVPAMARSQPDGIAVAVQRARGGSVQYHTLTFQELDQASNRYASGLEQLGITAGMRTVLMVTPGVEFFSLVFALFKMGAVPVLVDPGMGLKNLKKCLADADPAAFIGIPKAHIARMVLSWARESLRIRVVAGRWLPGAGTSLKEVGALGSQDYAMVASAPEDPAAILFTSGSTGVPKGAVYSHGIFNAQLDLLRDAYGIEPGERDLATFPLFALFGPALGMTAVIPDMDATRPAKANPANLVAAARDWEATNMFASPALIDKLGRYGAAEGIKLPQLKRVVSAGAPAEPASLERFLGMLEPGADVYPSYGATEALPVSRISAREFLNDTIDRMHAGDGVCVGRPLPGVEVRIIEVTGEAIEAWRPDLEVAPGTVGEIAVKGPMVTGSYFKKPEATALAKIPLPDGSGYYHRMGDVGWMDPEGRLWMCGRKSQRVITAKGTLFTVACERVFYVHPHVRRAALVGVERNGTTKPVLCIELEPGSKIRRKDRESIRDELFALARANPMTEGIETVLFHPKFPVDIRHNAKIFREKLAVWADKQLP